MDSFRMVIAELFRPYSKWTPRGYGFVYRLLLGSYYGNYPADSWLKKTLICRHRVFWDSTIRANVYVDIGDWACRMHYFQGIYYDRIVPALINRILKNGGTFIDVGANRGIHSLCAAVALKGKGQVIAFEPHPTTFGVLKAHMVINGVANCELKNMGLAAEKGELFLNAFSDDHSGTCSFLATSEIAEQVTVPVSTLDDEIEIDHVSGPILLKIDVEGFEHLVIQGANSLLEREDVTVVCEVTDKWLKQAGSSAHQLYEDMIARGYKPFLPSIRFKSLIFESLELQSINELPNRRQFDIVFIKKGY